MSAPHQEPEHLSSNSNHLTITVPEIPSDLKDTPRSWKPLVQFISELAKNTLDKILYSNKRNGSKSDHPLSSYDATDKRVKLVTRPSSFGWGLKIFIDKDSFHQQYVLSYTYIISLYTLRESE